MNQKCPHTDGPTNQPTNQHLKMKSSDGAKNYTILDRVDRRILQLIMAVQNSPASQLSL